MVEHKVDDYSRHRNVEPHGESPACYATVTRKVSAKRACHCDEYEGEYDGCEHRMREEYAQIDGAYGSLARKARQPLEDEVICKIRDEKERRRQERPCHHAPVRAYPPATNEEKARDQKHRAQAVENRVQVRQLRVIHDNRIFSKNALPR